MNHYYISDKTKIQGFIEVTECEFESLVGSKEARPYVGKVYCGTMAIDDVPEELREETQAVVDARIARYGKYEDLDISKTEALNIIMGGHYDKK